MRIFFNQLKTSLALLIRGFLFFFFPIFCLLWNVGSNGMRGIVLQSNFGFLFILLPF